MHPRGGAAESSTHVIHVVAECEIYKEERDVYEEMRKIECR